MALPTPGDRAAETSTTTGTGTYTLLGAISGWVTVVVACGDGATLDYLVRDQAGGAEFEVVRGLVTDAGSDTLTRGTILASSNSGSAVDWGAGTREIVVTFTADAYNQLAAGEAKNAIINGGFDIWQRGTSFLHGAPGEWTADRWFTDYGGASAVGTTSQQAFTLGQTDVPNEPTYFLRFDKTTAGTAADSVIRQSVESVRTFAEQTVTMSLWARQNSGTGENVILRLRQHFGTGGSPSSTVDLDSSAIALTSSWQLFTFTTTLGSISGKTLGTDGNDHVQATLVEDNNVLLQVDVAQVQLESGPVATDFEQRPIAEELALCKRYFERIAGQVAGETVANMTGRSASTSGGHYGFEVEKRSIPSFTTNGSAWGLQGLSGESLSSLTYDGATTKSVQIKWTDTGAPFTTAAAYNLFATNTTDYIDVDSEI